MALGEQATEDEEFDKAFSEFKECIRMQTEMFEPDDRRIATA